MELGMSAKRYFINSNQDLICIQRRTTIGGYEDRCRWIIHYPVDRVHYYATREEVGGLILRFRETGQITGLSTFDLLIG